MSTSPSTSPTSCSAATTTPFMVTAPSPSPTDSHSPPLLSRRLDRTVMDPSQEIQEILKKYNDAKAYLSAIKAGSASAPTSPEGRCNSARVIETELEGEISKDFFKEVILLIKTNDLDLVAKFMVKAREIGRQLSSLQTIECLEEIDPKNIKMFHYFNSITAAARPSSPGCLPENSLPFATKDWEDEADGTLREVLSVEFPA